jgi:hypothetical protein
MAVAIRKLPPDEALRVFPQRRQQDLSEYVTALRGLGAGEAASVDRQGISDRALKRRLSLAAKQLGYRLKWSRQASPELLYFQVAGTSPAKAPTGRRRGRTGAPEAAPPTEPAAPKTGRGRRRRAA